MVDHNIDDELSDIEHEIMSAYVTIYIDYIKKHYLRTPMCNSILLGNSYMQDTWRTSTDML